MKVSIVGLGLMGGSFALALKDSGCVSSVVGYDISEENRSVALDLGIVDSIVSFDDICSFDVVVLAIPVGACVSFLNSMTNVPETVTIIDLGSTKESISKDCPPHIRKNLVAAHPMTGTEYSGPKAAKVDLYTGKTVVLCDLELSGNRQIEIARSLFERLNMNVVEMSSKTHDLHASFISHLPHLISFSIANTVLKQEDKRSILTLAAGGFKDMSRLAKSSPAMWREIFLQNRENVLISIDSFKKELAKFEEALKSYSDDELTELMTNANGLYGIFK